MAKGKKGTATGYQSTWSGTNGNDTVTVKGKGHITVKTKINGIFLMKNF